MTQALRQVPQISLLNYIHGDRSDQHQFVDNLYRGFVDYGFVILIDHPLEKSLIDDAYQKVADFFSLPVEVKSRYVCPQGGGQRGYTSFGQEHAKDNNAPDLKEFWHVGREVAEGHPFKPFYPDNVWPEGVVPGFKKTLCKIYDELDQASTIILEALGRALDLPEGYFTEMVTLGNSILRPIYYPPVDTKAYPGSVRSAAHEDINLITILMGATASGLELLDRDGSWLPVQTKEGQLVVDSGDMLSRLCNDKIPATTHRVVNPEDSNNERYSMPFFVHPHPHTTLECIPSCRGDIIKYPPINSHQFLLQRLQEIGLM